MFGVSRMEGNTEHRPFLKKKSYFRYQNHVCGY
jgi:hypothetical protein